MSTRTPIQIPVELKERMDQMKDKLRSSSQHEMIGDLIDYYNKGEKQKLIDYEAKNAEKKRQDETMLQLTLDSKKAFNDLKYEFAFRSDVSTLDFLMVHYLNSGTVCKEALELLKRDRR
jgi:hypothetical protein